MSQDPNTRVNKDQYGKFAVSTKQRRIAYAKIHSLVKFLRDIGICKEETYQKFTDETGWREYVVKHWPVIKGGWKWL